MPANNVQNIGPQRHSPARALQEGIRGFEARIDDALIDGSDLLAAMLRTAASAKMSPQSTQAALDRHLTNLATGVRLRAGAILTHQDLRDAGRKIDLRVLGWGAGDESPDITQDEADAARSGVI